MNKNPIGKRLSSICSISAEDVPNGISGIFLVWYKKAKTEDLVKSLEEFVQKLDAVAAVIFTLINVQCDWSQSNNSHAIFAMISF